MKFAILSSTSSRVRARLQAALFHARKKRKARASSGEGEEVIEGGGAGVGLATVAGVGARKALTLVDSGVSASDLTTYTFSGKTLGAGLIIIAGNVRAATAITISSITVDGVAASIDVNAVNGNTSSAFIASVVNSAATGDIVITLSGSAARCGIAVYRFEGYSQSSAYRTATATRAATAGTMSPNLVGAIDDGFVIGCTFNGLGPGHRIGAASQKVAAQTNYNVTVDCQSGDSTWTGLTEGVDLQMEATGTAISMAACAAAFK